VFGYVAHVKITKPDNKKLEDRSKPMIFDGYEACSTAYRCYDPCTKRVHISRDVIFDEDACWDWSDDQSEDLCSDFIVGGDSKFFHTIQTQMGVLDFSEPSLAVEADQSSGGGHVTPASQDHGISPKREVTPQSGARTQIVTPPIANLDADHDDAPLRLRHITDILGLESPPGQAARHLHEELMLVRGEESSTFS
jgi:hypothetical protein